MPLQESAASKTKRTRVHFRKVFSIVCHLIIWGGSSKTVYPSLLLYCISLVSEDGISICIYLQCKTRIVLVLPHLSPVTIRCSPQSHLLRCNNTSVICLSAIKKIGIGLCVVFSDALDNAGTKVNCAILCWTRV